MAICITPVRAGLLAAVAAGVVGVVAATATAWAQTAKPAAAAASAPMTAASRVAPVRNAAITAAENAKEPGNQRPEERVTPQISIPLKSRSGVLLPAQAGSAPAAATGGVNEGVARCLATSDAGGKAACERALAASAPARPAR
jgi:uncharacterized iron-regulated membrane protein